jgi:hypothetical protein
MRDARMGERTRQFKKTAAFREGEIYQRQVLSCKLQVKAPETRLTLACSLLLRT